MVSSENWTLKSLTNEKRQTTHGNPLTHAMIASAVFARATKIYPRLKIRLIFVFFVLRKGLQAAARDVGI
jgi:hypothetical protein